MECVQEVFEFPTNGEAGAAECGPQQGQNNWHGSKKGGPTQPGTCDKHIIYKSISLDMGAKPLYLGPTMDQIWVEMHGSMCQPTLEHCSHCSTGSCFFPVSSVRSRRESQSLAFSQGFKSAESLALQPGLFPSSGNTEAFLSWSSEA